MGLVMDYSSEKVSDNFFEINHCDVLDLKTHDYQTLRERGRVDYYVMYILRGSCTVVENGDKIRASDGSLIVYLPGERQEYCFCGEDKTVYAYAHFSGRACKELMAKLGFEGKRVIPVGTSPQLELLFRNAVNECYLHKPFWEITAASLLLEFLTSAARMISSSASKWTPTLDKVIQDMHRNYAQNNSVSHYAAMCHLSESRFAHLFKQATGIAPKQYLLRIKTDAACRLLSTTDLSVTEIAAEVGIEDINYFCRLIKKRTGKTPRELR